MPAFLQTKITIFLYFIIKGGLRQYTYIIFPQSKNVNIKFDIFSCFYRFAVLHNT